MNNLKKRSVAYLLIIVMLVISGCAKETSSDKENTVARAMGRYMEEEYKLPEGAKDIIGVGSTADGSIKLFDSIIGAFTSSDGGKTFKAEENSGFELIQNMQEPWEDVVIDSVAISPDGIWAILFDCYAGNTMQKRLILTDNNQIIKEFTSESKEVQFAEDMAEAYGEESDINPEETEVLGEALKEGGNIKNEKVEDDLYSISEVKFLSDGTLYGYQYNNIYGINQESGILTQVYKSGEDIMNNGIHDYTVIDNTLITVGRTGADLYNIEAEEPMEGDAVLNDTILENMSGVDREIKLASAVDGKNIYLTLLSGLYRHGLYGSVMERVIDGNLTALGNPAMKARNLIPLGNKEFLIYYTMSEGSGGKLLHYFYDENISTVPEKELKVYSLKDLPIIRQSIAVFQRNNPEYLVSYEVGISGKDAVTLPDALRLLNTEIMAEKGADILILDEMPIETYIEKGILKDMNDLLSQIPEGDLYKNIVSAYKQKDKLYAIPSRFQIPVMVGEKEQLQKIKNISSLADAVETMRQQQPEGKLIGNAYTPQEIVKCFYAISAPGWYEKGAVKEEYLMEFLRNTKRIYAADMQGVDEESLKYYMDNTARYEEIYGEDSFNQYGLSAETGVLGLLVGDLQIAVGVTKGITWDLANITGLIAKKDSIDFVSWQTQPEGVFVPKVTLGINTKTKDEKGAEAFVLSILSEESQNINLETGFPVNQAAFDSCANISKGGEAVGTSGTSKADGSMILLNSIWPTKEQMKQLEDIILKLQVPASMDNIVLDAILAQADAFYTGKIDEKQAADAILQKVNLYLTE